MKKNIVRSTLLSVFYLVTFFAAQAHTAWHPSTKPSPHDTVTVLFKSRKHLAHSLHKGTLTISTNHGLLQISAISPKIMEIKNFPGQRVIPDSSVAIVMKPQPVKTAVQENSQWLWFRTDSLTAAIHKNPVFVTFIYHGDTLLKEDKGYFERSDNNGLQFHMSKKEHYFGLGERAVNQLRGNDFQLYNQAHYGYEIGEKNLNFSVPLLLSSKKYLLLFDNPEKGYADVGKTKSDVLEFGAMGGLMKYVFVTGYDFQDIYRQYGRLTGTQPLPPRWVLGNLQSRMAYRTQQETDSIVALMQKNNFPIDAIILDFYWFGDSIKGYLGKLAWYKPHWPNPARMIAGFRKKGVKTVLITEPYLIDTLKNFRIADSLKILATDSLGKTYNNTAFYFGPAGLLDIFLPKAQNWFWQQYQKQIKIGVAGWWGDLGEPETHPFDEYCIGKSARQIHNIYALYWEKMLFDKYRQYYPRRRLFDLNRAGYAGSQRYSIFPWTGDVSRSWGGLQAQLPLLIHMSLSGFPFIHSDAGGFAQGQKDGELYTRWLQMACFSPILRPHGSGIPSEPVFFDDTTQRIVRRFMEERYRLLPYLYTAVWQAHTAGIPVVKPLFFNDPADSIAYTLFDEYLWGNDFLIAPIIKPGETMRKVYLPKGYWYNYWNNKRYKGGRFVTLHVSLKTIPVFVRAGAFIPLVRAVHSTDDYSSENLTVRYFSSPEGKPSQSLMYEDDGKTFGAYEHGAYQLLHFTTKEGKHFVFSMEGGTYQKRPKTRAITLEIVSKKGVTKKHFRWKGTQKKSVTVK